MAGNRVAIEVLKYNGERLMGWEGSKMDVGMPAEVHA